MSKLAWLMKLENLDNFKTILFVLIIIGYFVFSFLFAREIYKEAWWLM